MTYTVATFNMKNADKEHFGLRAASIEAFFEQISPDIVGTQELTAPSFSFFETLGDGYEWVGEPRTAGDKGEYTAIFYKKTVFELVETDTFWLSRLPQKHGSRSWLTLFPRICTWCVLRSKADGTLLRIYNTHLDCLSPLARLRGVALIKKLAEKHDSAKLSGTIIMGDFNAYPSSRTVKTLLENGGGGEARRNSFNVLFKADPVNMRTYHGFRGRTKGLPIDYIFTSKSIEITSAYIDRTAYGEMYPSDHYPVVATITVNGEGSMK